MKVRPTQYYAIAFLLLFACSTYRTSTAYAARKSETSNPNPVYTQEQIDRIVDRVLAGEMVSADEKSAAYPTLLEREREAIGNNGSIDASGGPDAFGYFWRDNDNEPQGPVYNWYDISATGTNTNLRGDDANAGPFPIGFTFPFYGQNYTTFKVCTNGWLTLDATSTTSAFSNVAIPNVNVPNSMVAVNWDDMYVDTAAGHYVKYQTLGIDTLVVTWNVRHLGGTSLMTYQAILVSNGNILFQYNTVDSTQITSTIGIENQGGTVGLQVAFGTNYTTSGRAVRLGYSLTMPRPAIMVSPADGAVNVPVTASIQWQRSDTNTTNMDVFFSNDQALVLSQDSTVRVLSATQDTIYDPPGSLAEGTRYYWRVLSRNATTGEEMSTAVRSFRTFSPGLSGTKTIGGANPDYPTISAAIDALNASGTGTGVTFLIRGGTYDESPDSILVTATSGPNSPVVFKPTDTLGVVINKTCTANATSAFILKNCDNVTFDGRHPDAPGRNFITVNALGASGSNCFRFHTGTDNNVIRNVNMTVAASATSTNTRPIFTLLLAAEQPQDGCLNDSIVECVVNGGYYGMFLSGLNSPVIPCNNWYVARNKVLNFTYYGIYVSAEINNCTFEGNEIYRTTPGTTTNYGIAHTNALGRNNRLIGNWIHDLAGTATSTIYGMYLSNGPGLFVANNMVSISATAGTVYGIYVSTQADNKFYHNTVRLTGMSGGNYSSYGLYISGATSDSVANNIFVNERTGGSTTNYNVAMSLPNASPFAFSNNNLFSVNSDSVGDNRYVVRYVTTNYNTIEDLRASTYTWDANSTSMMPVFVGDTDLHINVTATQPVESAGMPIASVATDFDNDLRNPATPDIGADEGTFRRLAYGIISGVVQDSSTAMNPIPDALVAIGNYRTTTNAMGEYSVEVRSGTYAISISASCYISLTDTGVVVDSAGLVTRNYYLLFPEITAMPTSLEMEVPFGQSRSATLILSNPGNGNMTWRSRVIYGQDSNVDNTRSGSETPFQVFVKQPAEARFGPAARTTPHSDFNRTASTVSSKEPLNGTPEQKAEYERWFASQQTMNSPAIDQTWGPDGFGYEALDIVEPTWYSNLAYNDITSVGTSLLTGDDTGINATFDGFSFTFYGQAYTSAWFCTNGFIQLGVANGTNSLSNTALPNTTVPNAIFGLHDDLVTTVRKYYDQTNNVFYVQWDGYRYSTSSDTIRFQMQLHGNNNAIVILYQTIQEAAVSATIGIQNGDGTNNQYVQTHYSATAGAGIPNPMEGYGVCFLDMSPGGGGGFQRWLLVNPTQGEVLPSQVAEVFIQATIPETDSIGTVRNAILQFVSNACPSISVPISVVTIDTVVNSSGEASHLPIEYKLHQNYPNPFNPSTEIRFDLKVAGLTKLKVFNVLGREVASLVNEQLPAGYHSVRFDAAPFAAGVYFYRIESGNFHALRKMVLVK